MVHCYSPNVILKLKQHPLLSAMQILGLILILSTALGFAAPAPAPIKVNVLDSATADRPSLDNYTRKRHSYIHCTLYSIFWATNISNRNNTRHVGPSPGAEAEVPDAALITVSTLETRRNCPRYDPLCLDDCGWYSYHHWGEDSHQYPRWPLYVAPPESPLDCEQPGDRIVRLYVKKGCDCSLWK